MAKKIIFHLDKVLEEKGLGQREVSRMANIRHATLHQIYHNKIERLPMDLITKVIEVLGISDIREIMEIVEVDEEISITPPTEIKDKKGTSTT